MPFPITWEEHPHRLSPVLHCVFSEPLGRTPSPEWLLQLLRKEGVSPFPAEVGQDIRDRVRALLRWGGFKPSGRSKPASEFLERACGQATLGSINLAVDLCNVVSLWSGLPISVLDVDLCQEPFSVKVIRDKSAYVFNPSGQELDIEGLLCFCDGQGPCGSPVKDSQRTKTSPETRRTLSVLWGHQDLKSEVQTAYQWYCDLCNRAGGLASGAV